MTFLGVVSVSLALQLNDLDLIDLIIDWQTTRIGCYVVVLTFQVTNASHSGPSVC